MIIESLNEYLETLAGYIYDNDKLVTYKWLSKELEIHVNIAKHVLWEFVQRRQGEELECTFLLIGTLPDGGMRVEVVKQENLDTAKKKFSKLISEHIYSLQKVLPDINLLAIAGDGDVQFSAIKCNESIERSDEEMHILRWGVLTKNVQAVSEHKSSVKPIAEGTTERRQKSPEKKTTEVKQTAQKKGFNSLFGKANNKQKNSVLSNEEKKEPETSNKGKQISPKQNGSTSPKKKIQKSGMDCFLEQGKHQQKINSPPAVKNSVTNSTVKEKEKEKSTSEKNNMGKNNARGKKRNRSKEVKANVIKRKRITVKSDSSEAESSNAEEEEEQSPPSPEPQPEPVVSIHSPSPPKVKHEGGKRKVLKMVDKTFEEDGYLVTKKVHVYESCSEDEVEIEMKKSVTPESRPEPKGKKNTKQTTLINFFKKS